MHRAEQRGDETFDPANWNDFRALAHRMVDDTIEFLADLSHQPVWQPVPGYVQEALVEPIPRESQGEEQAYDHFRNLVLPYANGNRHPRFFGWVQGNGTALGMMADMLAAAMNPHMAGFNQAPALVERQVISWLAELLGWPSETSGVFVAGGTMANILGVAVARHAQAGFDVRKNGLQGNDHPRLILYGSTEVHSWLQKAVEFLGLGNSSYRRIPVDAEYRIDIRVLAQAVQSDRAAGYRPFCVVGSAGTINTGATDDLQALAAYCRTQDLWFHIDGAYGALARLSPKLRSIVAGVEEADSIGVDLHKWMCLPFECACALVRDPALHREAFSVTPNYLAEMTRGVSAGGLPFAERGIDLTRGFKALKAWMSLKAYGINKIVRIIEQNVEQSRYLADLIDRTPDLEVAAPVALNIVCFRYVLPNCSEAQLNLLNQELLVRIQESGVAVPSSTILSGERFAIRAANVNHRTRRSDIEQLIDITTRIGREIATEHNVIA